MTDNERIIEIIATELKLNKWQVSNVINLLGDGATIPFISRYRKEMTDNLDEVSIQQIQTRQEELEELIKRKNYILGVIESQEKLTDELREKIESCWQPNIIEDLYLPYRPKRRTRAEIARGKGLEPLAKIIMAQHSNDVEQRACEFLNDQVESIEDAIAGAKDIIAEWISEREKVRAIVRDAFSRFAVITSNVVKGKEMEGENYYNYYEYRAPLRRASSHQILAMRRGEKEGFLHVAIDVNEADTIERLERSIVKSNSQASKFVAEALRDSYKRLVRPSIETEFAALSKAKADETAINMFADNLRQLLFAAPLHGKNVMGVDPGFRTGCKIVCLDQQGNLQHHSAIFPHPPHHDRDGATDEILTLVEKYAIDAIAIGNGTASRETERFFSHLPYERKVQVFVVSENGASIYSASKIAREEFPDKDVTVRGAVSIGRRLIDPLAELVKIDPKSIGVGQYQHDVDQTKLRDSLEFVVESCVNKVGVNVNTASKELLTYVSGLGPVLAQNIVNYRAENGNFRLRRDLMRVARMGDKAFQQSAGFLRIPDGDNPLDNTAVHPEHYPIVMQMAKDNGCSIEQLIADKELRKAIDLQRYVSKTIGLPTLTDIMEELDKPGRDPRTTVDAIEFDENVTTIEDVHEGMVLNGIVTNITAFGAFVDFGIKQNGLLHISQMGGKRNASPTDILKLHQHLKVKVIGIDLDRKRISLSIKGVEQ